MKYDEIQPFSQAFFEKLEASPSATWQDPSQRPSTAVALQWPWLRTAQASSPPSSPSPLSTSRRRTVAAAAAQRQVQLPAETERWKDGKTGTGVRWYPSDVGFESQNPQRLANYRYHHRLVIS